MLHRTEQLRNCERRASCRSEFEFEAASPMLGLKSFRTAAVVIGGIELAEKIKKGQFKTGKLGGLGATMPEIWRDAVAAAEPTFSWH